MAKSTVRWGLALLILVLFSSLRASDIGQGGGGVTAVTGTSPVVSSGGATPDISCPTCSAAGLDKSVIGGIVGGGIGVAGGTTGFEMWRQGTLSTTRQNFPTGALLGPINVCFPTAILAGYTTHWWWRSYDYNKGLFRDWPEIATNIPGGTPAGCVTAAADYVVPVQIGTVPMAWLAGIAGGTAPTWSGWSASVYGINSQPMGNIPNGAPTVAAGTEKFNGWEALQQIHITEHFASVAIPVPGVLTALKVRLASAQPATGAMVVRYRVNGANGTTTVTIPSSSPDGWYQSSGVADGVLAGDYFSVSFNNAAAAASGSVMSWSGLFTPQTPANHSGFFVMNSHAAGLAASASRWMQPYGQGYKTTEISARTPFPRNGTLDSLYCFVFSAPANDATLTVVIDGAGSAITGTILAAGAFPGVQTVSTNTAAITAQQSVSLEVASGAGAVMVLDSCSIGFGP